MRPASASISASESESALVSPSVIFSSPPGGAPLPMPKALESAIKISATYKTDVFEFGQTLFQLFTGKTLATADYDIKSIKDELYAVVEPALVGIILLCLIKEAEKRPSSEIILTALRNLMPKEASKEKADGKGPELKRSLEKTTVSSMFPYVAADEGYSAFWLLPHIAVKPKLPRQYQSGKDPYHSIFEGEIEKEMTEEDIIEKYRNSDCPYYRYHIPEAFIDKLKDEADRKAAIKRTANIVKSLDAFLLAGWNMTLEIYKISKVPGLDGPKRKELWDAAMKKAGNPTCTFCHEESISFESLFKGPGSYEGSIFMACSKCLEQQTWDQEAATALFGFSKEQLLRELPRWYTGGSYGKYMYITEDLLALRRQEPVTLNEKILQITPRIWELYAKLPEEVRQYITVSKEEPIKKSKAEMLILSTQGQQASGTDEQLHEFPDRVEDEEGIWLFGRAPKYFVHYGEKPGPKPEMEPKPGLGLEVGLGLEADPASVAVPKTATEIETETDADAETETLAAPGIDPAPAESSPTSKSASKAVGRKFI